MLTASHILLGFAVLAVWLLSLWVHPFGRCPRCRGRRMAVPFGRYLIWLAYRHLTGSTRAKPRPRPCRVCKAIGRRQRIGSRTLHRTVRRIRGELDGQRKARQAALEENTR